MELVNLDGFEVTDEEEDFNCTTSHCLKLIKILFTFARNHYMIEIITFINMDNTRVKLLSIETYVQLYKNVLEYKSMENYLFKQRSFIVN